MRVVILQPGYLPWLGFFDLMYRADIFVILDDVQYTIRDWRSRNRVKTPDGILWLTVPIKAKGIREKLINDVEIDTTQQWQKNHLKSLESFYKKTKYFDEIINVVSEVYKKNYNFLIDIDMDIILKIYHYFYLKTKICFSSDILSTGKKDEKLLSICKHLNATHYLSGNAAQEYLREPIFLTEGITVEWHNYRHPYYNQLWLKEQGFISHLSIVDLLFNHGPDSLAILTNQKVIPAPEGIKIRRADEV
jgi:hypothetical protein